MHPPDRKIVSLVKKVVIPQSCILLSGSSDGVAFFGRGVDQSRWQSSQCFDFMTHA